MELHTLKPAAGSLGRKRRRGRGQGSTLGGTSGKGHKGAQSRSGYKSKPRHEGGQMPLQRRMPKVGFNNFTRTEYIPLNLDKIQMLLESKTLKEVTVENLREKGLLAKRALVKVLAGGELKDKVNVSVHAISESAKQKIEALGGTVTIVKK